MSSLLYNSAHYGQLAIIPYPPSAAIETLEFSTDILPSYTAENEQRNMMRAIPRQTFEMTYPLDYMISQGAFNLAFTQIRTEWGIPLWVETQLATVALGDSIVAVDTIIHDLRANSPVLLFQSTEKWEIQEITSTTATQITLVGTTQLKGSVYVVPILTGWATGDISTLPSGYDASCKMIFQIDQVLTTLGQTVPAQYNAQDVYTDPYDLDTSGASNNSITQQQNTKDYSVGNIYQISPWLASRYSKMYNIDGFDMQDYWNLKDFFYRRAGCFRSFYSPTFESNLRKASTGNVVSTFQFYDDTFSSVIPGKRSHIAFQLDDDTWQLRTITANAALGGGLAQISLDSALNVDASRILTVSYVALNRLDTDSIQINHKTSGYFTSQFPVLEIAQ